MALVVDACIVAAWYLPDETYDKDTHLRALASGIIVPPIWALEVQNVFLLAEKRGRITAGEADAALDELLETLDISFDQRDEMFGAEMRLGRAYGLTSYDAAYLELAMRRGVRLVTDDKRLAAAARRLGVLDGDGT
jgi:predicted nucleic acid-binding protein